MKKKIGIIGQFPPPMHGLSKALETLYNSYLKEEFDLTKIDITNNKKFLFNLIKILFSKLDLYYLTISQSKFGNIRDIIIVKLVQLKKRKIIVHLHGGGFRNILDYEFGAYQKKVNYKILSKVDAAIVLSDSLKYIFEGIVPNENIHVVKNCVDDEFVISNEVFNSKMLMLEKKREFKILYLSNFIQDKGYKEVLQLARLTKIKDDNRFKFIFAGKFFNENDKKEFFEYIKLNNLEDIVNYKGVVLGESKLDIFRESDIFILLSRYKNEGQPISIIEAAANGMKIISTNHAGIKDILSSDYMTIIDKNDIDINKIYDSMLNEYYERYKFIQEREYVRKYILKNFSEREYLNSILYVFNKILKK